MDDFTLRERIRYAFDNTLAKGTIALIGWLAVVASVSIALLALVVALTGARPVGESEPLSFAEAAWESLMRTLDPGTMGGDTGWLFRALMFVVTLIGIFIMSTLIGVLASGLQERLDELRKGRSRVVERGHTVVLGWSEQIFPILTELIEANRSRKDACIVVLGDQDKVAMEDAVRAKVDDMGSTRIVCRTGSAIELHDLQIVSVDTARSIIILAPSTAEGARNTDPDVDVIKALLAITNNPKRKKARYHIVAEIRDPKNVDVAKMVGKDEVELVLVGDLIARIMAQTCQQSGLSVVYTELLDFGGDEIYFKEEPALVGKTYAEVLSAYEKCAPIGIRDKRGGPRMNPPMDTVVGAGDKIIVIAEDDDKIHLGAPPPHPDMDAIALSTPPPAQPERSLILGWNWRAPLVINELDHRVPAGSSLHVVADYAAAEETLKTACADLEHQRLTFQAGDTTDRKLLDALDVASYDHLIVLCYSDLLEPQRADATTLITLLHLRDIAQRSGKRVPIVSEMLDIKNRALAEVTRADDFIVSDRLVSLMMSQVSENKELNSVLMDVFSHEGSEIYLKPVVGYVKTGVPMAFTTILEAARRKNETAIGYKLARLSADADAQYGVRVNPKKSELVTFGADDRIIVVSED